MPTALPRKRFQIHLSTAIVMMFVAGGLILANVTADKTAWSSSYGWPATAMTSTSDAIQALFDANRRGNLAIGNYCFTVRLVFVDLVFAITTLYATYQFCEYLIRRAAQKS